MSEITKINYLGSMWGISTGCVPVSPGCRFCYARVEHERRRKAFLAGKKMAPQYAKPFSEIQFHESRLDQPLHWRKPRDIGVAFGGDWMLATRAQIDRMLEVMGACKRHTFFTLTKRANLLYSKLYEVTPDAPIRELGEGDYLPNVFHGATVCNQPELDRNVPEILKVLGKHWISIEPMLEHIQFKPWHFPPRPAQRADDDVRCERCGELWDADDHECPEGFGGWLDWVTIGCESGPNRRYVSIADILSVVEQCRAANVPCFVKQIPVPKFSREGGAEGIARFHTLHGPKRWDNACHQLGWRVSRDMDEWPEALRVREKP